MQKRSGKLHTRIQAGASSEVGRFKCSRFVKGFLGNVGIGLCVEVSPPNKGIPVKYWGSWIDRLLPNRRCKGVFFTRIYILVVFSLCIELMYNTSQIYCVYASCRHFAKECRSTSSRRLSWVAEQLVSLIYDAVCYQSRQRVGLIKNCTVSSE